MSQTTTRRPLPALAFLAALCVLTAIVWWRVLHRDQTDSGSSGGTLTAAAPAQSCNPKGSPKLVLPVPRAVSLKVLNGSTRDGLATTVLAELKARGFKTTTADTVKDSSQLTALGKEVAEIRYGNSGRLAAEEVAYYISGSKMVKISRSDASVDVVLGKSYSKLNAQAQVNQAISRAARPC
jgi:hypothetical protein